ncbi:MAG TPA: carbohydrate ABC transporter permease [Chloroflexi bacterium]|nr:carbohydrate ABC transporter permease [Chloroflexota bacterium]
MRGKRGDPYQQVSEALKRTIIHIILLGGATTMVAPFVWMISTSLKTNLEVFRIPPTFIPAVPQWHNYLEIFRVVPYGRWFLNSVIITVTQTVLYLFVASLAGFTFARLRFPGRDLIFTLYLATLMVPSEVTLIPKFILMKQLHLIDTYIAVILPGIFNAYGVFLLRQFFMTLPESLEEAAIIDGASYFRIYWNIILPLAGPALATLGIFSFRGAWNDFMWPLIVINSEEMKPLSVGLASFHGLYETNWPHLMAASTVALIPMIIVFVLAQKYFVRGIALTGLKEG